ncbi:GntR family transcriptional regulator [Sphingomonas sp. UYEF23]|uniref:GntR family transcriptional regulator n=1 Tax=Sphingomonas sp. UYEF23 TaxID=1756408 RepID=UPI0033931816
MKRSLKAEAADDDTSGRTMADIVYRKLRDDIVVGVLAPGTPLRSDEIRAAYGTGISPLREALTRLTAEQLVTSIGQRGFRVAPLSAEDVLDTMETRILVETEALRLSIARGGVAWEAELAAAGHALKRTPFPIGPGAESDTWAPLHWQFHFALLSACGSKWLLRLFDILFAQAERHRLHAMTLGQPAPQVRDRVGEHDAIFKATMDRNARLATAELDRHYRLSAEHVAAVLRGSESGKDARSVTLEIAN